LRQYIYYDGTDDPAYYHASSTDIAKIELSYFRKITRAIEWRSDNIALAKEALGSPSHGYLAGSRVQSSGGHDRMAERLSEIMDRERGETAADISDLLRQRKTILRAIEDLSFPYDRILIVRYTQHYKTLVAANTELQYEYNYLCGLHGKALVAYAAKRCFPQTFDGH
jgi:hypothetical protein